MSDLTFTRGVHMGSPSGYAAYPLDQPHPISEWNVISHDAGCCARRGCHQVCSHLCGTDLHTCDGSDHSSASSSDLDYGEARETLTSSEVPLLDRQVDEFMGWLLRRTGLRSLERDYDAVRQRVRLFALAATHEVSPLLEALDDAINHAEAIGCRCPNCAARVDAWRQARSWYPASLHEHYWTDAPDDEEAWHCVTCGVTEYPEGEGDGLRPGVLGTREDNRSEAERRDDYLAARARGLSDAEARAEGWPEDQP